MKFLIGSQNFGLDMPNSDKDYFKFYMPELRDLCRPIPRGKEQDKNDSMVKHIDIRSLPSLFYKSNLDTLQILYSKEVIDGGDLHKYFKMYEEEISSINIPRLYRSVMGMAKSRFKKQTTKDLAHIIFSMKTLIQFEQQGFRNLRACFEHDEKELYRSIREGNYGAWLVSAKEWESIAQSKEDEYNSMEPNEEFKKKFDEDIARMVLSHLNRGEPT